MGSRRLLASRVRSGNKLAPLALLFSALSLVGCGFMGVELSQLAGGADTGDGDGSGTGRDARVGDGDDGPGDTDGGDGAPDGTFDAGTLLPGNPDEVEVCVLQTCTSDVAQCPDDSGKSWPGICGCAVSDGIDEDRDGTPDCIDLCPGTPDRLPNGTCGCPAAAADSDADGTPNCIDYCPGDPNKTGPGVCGCEVADHDSDGDGMPDCIDRCAADPMKVVPGVCGCGVEDNDLDTDGDGIRDCVDTCGGFDDTKYVSDASCGVGYCLTTNTPSSCVERVETACVPGEPRAATDTTCDGVDDDCDGELDEEYMPETMTCGVGACRRQGHRLCVDGAPFEVCTAGMGSADDATCDGIDDDCDGEIDEDYPTRATSCGVGACARSGSLICSNGEEVNTCSQGSAAADDASCDGIDNDCDGQIDEDYVPVPTATTCGAGACQRNGSRICDAGNLVDICIAGTGGGNDATCDGVDDDCDGQIDEDYVPVPTTCGVGSCARNGSLVCSNGRVVNTCSAGQPAANDRTCNNIDDDCDGQVDEDYIVVSSCGVGYCQSTNTPSSCVNGVETACMPGTPRANNDTTPDGVDDDCDGQVDEDACIARTETYGYATNLRTLAPGPCKTVTVHLWGGAGAAGAVGGNWGASVRGGAGGAGGYAYQVVTLPTGATVQLAVGQGGQGCGSPGGGNPTAIFQGGAGNKSKGGAGVVGGGDSSTTGGAGGTGAGAGGAGRIGGGGGGAGSAPYGPFGESAAGGAGTVLLVNGTRQVVAGGGGGGGGAGADFTTNGKGGGAGGSGCSVKGVNGSGGIAGGGGGGGGGGVCVGSTTQTGSGRTPYNTNNLLPNGNALGGVQTTECAAGGNGYAVVTFAP